MAARTRASLRCFDRRRHLILEKGFSTANNVLESQLGQCLTNWNNVEQRLHRQRWKTIVKEQEESSKHINQEHRREILQLLDANQLAEPGLLVCRTPTCINFTARDTINENIQEVDQHIQDEHIRRKWPHYRWPLRSKTLGASSSAARISSRITVTVEYYRPERPRTCNSWDKTPRAMSMKCSPQSKHAPIEDAPAPESGDATKPDGPVGLARSKTAPTQLQVSPSEARTRFRNIAATPSSRPLRTNERDAMFQHWMSTRQQHNFDDKTRGMLLYRCNSAIPKSHSTAAEDANSTSEMDGCSVSHRLKSAAALENLLRVSKLKTPRPSSQLNEEIRRPKTAIVTSADHQSKNLQSTCRENADLRDRSATSMGEISSITNSSIFTRPSV